MLESKYLCGFGPMWKLEFLSPTFDRVSYPKIRNYTKNLHSSIGLEHSLFVAQLVNCSSFHFVYRIVKCEFRLFFVHSKSAEKNHNVLCILFQLLRNYIFDGFYQMLLNYHLYHQTVQCLQLGHNKVEMTSMQTHSNATDTLKFALHLRPVYKQFSIFSTIF